MKRLLGTLIAILLITTSQASTSQSGEHYTAHNRYAVQPKTVTLNAPARVKKIVKSKVKHLTVDDSDVIVVDDDDLATGYRRRDLTKIEHPEGISEKIRWKLFLARQLALLKHRELHG